MRDARKPKLFMKIWIRGKVLILASVLSLGVSKVNASTIGSQNEKQVLHVLINGNGLPVFADDGPVQGLETVLAAVLGQLVYSSGSLELKAGLLSRFHWDYENNWYVLELREGLVFHNGRKATSEDLEFSLLRGLLSKKGSWFKPFFANVQGIAAVEGKRVYQSGMISGIRILDSRKLAIKLDAPNPSFLHSLARSYFSLVPKEALQPDYLTWKKYPVGAGLYKIVNCSPDNSTITLKKVVEANSGVEEIIVSSKGNPQESALVIGASIDGTSLGLESSSSATSVTGVYFNFDNDLGRQLAFRKAISLAVARGPLVKGVPSYAEVNELLASQFWGRAGMKEQRNIKSARGELSKVKAKLPKEPLRIPVFNSEFENGNFGNYIGVLAAQFQEIGLNVEFYKSDKKFFDKADRTTPFRIISLGADVADPLVLFGLFRRGSPMTPHFPVGDGKFEKLYEKASKAAALDAKVMATKDLSKYFMAEVYAVPLFERRGNIGVNRAKIKNLGPQTGSLAVHLDQVVMQ